MPKIAMIGAGSVVFTKNLLGDILSFPALAESTISLHDIDPERLDAGYRMAQWTAHALAAHPTIEAHADRRAALDGADYVINMIQVGGHTATLLDFDIPRHYGLRQTIGDTMGIGGIFRALRTIPVLLDLCDEMDELAPDALLLNYVNPMAANCWAVAEGSGRPHIGLCHSVQGTSEMLAKWIGVPYEEVSFLCAGINHQAFFLEFCRGKEDLYPLLWEAIERFRHPAEVISGTMFVVAVLGLAVNLVAFALLRRGAKESLNLEGAYLEVLSDTIGSVGVIVAAVVLRLTGWTWVDPVVGVGIGLFILPRTWRLAAKALRILVQAAPPHLDLEAVAADLAGIDQVVGVHDLHVWTLTSDMEVATAHLVVGTSADHHAVLDAARVVLAERHGIDHATLQVEPDDHEGCEELAW